MKAKITQTLINSLSKSDKPTKSYDIYDTSISGFHLRVYPSGRVSYFLYYRNEVNKINRVLLGKVGSLSLEQATRTAKQHIADIANNIDIQAVKKAKKAKAIELHAYTLQNFLDDKYKQWLETEQKSGPQTYNTIITAFKGYLSSPICKLTQDEIDSWRIKKIQAGLMNSTINRQVNALSGALTRAEKWKYIPKHPFKELGYLSEDSTPNIRYLSKDEYSRLMGALATRDNALKQARERGNSFRQKRGYTLLPSLLFNTYADRMTPIIILSLKTGLRRGETFGLRWENIDFEQKLITVTGDTSKVNKTRYIPMSKDAFRCLTNWKRQTPDGQLSGLVFPNDKGNKLTTLKKSWATIMSAAEITNFRWHDMRHDFASQMVMRNASLNAVRELCGHAKFETTLLYSHLSPSFKANAIALLDDDYEMKVCPTCKK